MNKYEVSFKDCVTYKRIEAETKGEAIEIALGWWVERMPQIIKCDKIEEEEE